MMTLGSEPAYPHEHGPHSGAATSLGAAHGLTKREAFAMAAMQGLLAASATYGGKTDHRDLLVADAIAHADALLAALSEDK